MTQRQTQNNADSTLSCMRAFGKKYFHFCEKDYHLTTVRDMRKCRMSKLTLEGKDNYGHPRQEFADKIAAMTDEDVYRSRPTLHLVVGVRVTITHVQIITGRAQTLVTMKRTAERPNFTKRRINKRWRARDS